jgi:hypothetical protein
MQSVSAPGGRRQDGPAGQGLPSSPTPWPYVGCSERPRAASSTSATATHCLSVTTRPKPIPPRMDGSTPPRPLPPPHPDALRDEGGFKREYDGHLWLKARSGSWVEVRLDAKVPGTVLLRDDGSGAVHYITYNNVQQVGGWRQWWGRASGGGRRRGRGRRAASGRGRSGYARGGTVLLVLGRLAGLPAPPWLGGAARRGDSGRPAAQHAPALPACRTTHKPRSPPPPPPPPGAAPAD